MKIIVIINVIVITVKHRVFLLIAFTFEHPPLFTGILLNTSVSAANL